MDGILHIHNMAGLALRHLEQENARLKARVLELEAQLLKESGSPPTT